MVAARLQLIARSKKVSSLSELPSDVVKLAYENGADPDVDLVVSYSYGEAATGLGYPQDSAREFYAGDPKGNFPGCYLMLNLGRGSNRNLWNSEVGQLDQKLSAT